MGLPLLVNATSVTILTVEGGTVPGPSPEAVQDYLTRHAIAAGTRHIKPEGRSLGEAILDETTALGADLLFKGAYTHTRLRQMIFGGATEDITAKSSLPVLMAH